MKKILLLLTMLAFIASCGNDGPRFLTKEQINKEKDDVINLIKEYNDAYEEQSFYKLESTLAEDVVFFGTDSAEVIKSRAEFKKALEENWKLYKLEWGEMVEIIIEMDQNATMASILYGIPIDMIAGENRCHIFTRVARNLKKEEGKWRISSGVIGVVASGKNYTEFMKALTNPPQEAAAE